MSRRLQSRGGDNLELLLDTMCNAFGGVMFIAMLLAVLSQFAQVTGKAVADPVEVKQLELERARLESALNELRSAQAEQARLLEMMKSVALSLERIEELQARNLALKSRIERTEKTAELMAALELAMKGEVRKLNLPRLVASNKLTVFFIIKWNRLFFLRRPTARTPHGPVNTSDVRHTESVLAGGSRAHEFEAIPGRGIPLDKAGWEESSAIREVLQYVSPETNSLHLAVYPDSYDALRTVRDFFLDKGYEYNWHVMPNEAVRLHLLSGGAGTPPPVQRHMRGERAGRFFHCASCGHEIPLEPRFIGLRMECPHCSAVVMVPSRAGESGMSPVASSSDAGTPPLPPPPSATAKSQPPEPRAKPEQRRKRSALKRAIPLLVAMLLLLLWLLFFRGSGGGAGGSSGPGFRGGEGADDLVASQKEARDQPTRQPGEAVQGTAGVSKSGDSSEVVLFERTDETQNQIGDWSRIGGGASFFGLSAEGKSFVYIVDRSGSMQGLPLAVAKANLKASIGCLKEDQEFFVFFYNQDSYPMPGAQMVSATEENKQACYNWITGMASGGGTQPTASLLAAIRMRPEVIFFLSDGAFAEQVCDVVRNAQRDSPVTIHTIGFVHRRGEKVLKRLADESGGTYGFVPGQTTLPAPAK